MDSFADLLQQGTAHAWLFVPTAILLGALHGLEPGHSKTMMAAFIIAIRGTILQAVLLGLSAALSHTAVVWAVALGGQYLGRGVEAEAIEPYLQLVSAAIIVAIALWMFWRIRQDEKEAEAPEAHDHHHHHHHHDDEHHIDTGHALAEHGHPHHGLDDEAMDAHARAHAQDIRRRFGSAGSVTTGQIMLFGLTGGLIPCPAAITVLLLCLQLKQLTLGVVLVACFSIGLAVTMVGAGVAASLSVHHVQKHWKGFSTLAHRAPYASGALMLLIAVYMGVSGWVGLMHA